MLAAVTVHDETAQSAADYQKDDVKQPPAQKGSDAPSSHYPLSMPRLQSDASRASCESLHMTHLETDAPHDSGTQRGLRRVVQLCMQPGVPSLLCVKVGHRF